MTNEQNQKTELLTGQFETDKNTLNHLSKSLESLGLDDIEIRLDHEGLTSRMMDATHVSLLDIRLNEYVFENFKVDNDIKISFNINELKNLVKTLDKNGSVLVIVKPYYNKMEISQNGFKTEIRINESDLSHEVPLPKIPYDSNITFNKESTKLFIQNLKKLNAQNDYFEINADNSSYQLSGDKVGSCPIESTGLFFKNDQPAQSRYSFEYIMPFLKSVNYKESFEIGFSNTKPLKISTMLKTGFIEFYLAPRVES